ncbi:Fcf2 pre-rRNA processing-domain-containing protein [Microdochium trichocladiopsis]|uniref:Fcf2 pre-rRNA processing-domain-containing protein n=1 Tax=Microdochium trichocladiopsis TaxID=1682393 RepID=A0A9P8YE76_9PEZI|nr:Fcf2 pre-rRNA processing-domain-containing protein [Microdochium trichocladiopsis]KAH7037820.1 Fcf2 pre-rRNA processing-domain-containing protein [Microdochium trichocladiopsis]
MIDQYHSYSDCHTNPPLLKTTMGFSELFLLTGDSPQAESTKADAGAKWFNMPKTNLTPELKRELQLIKMRDTLDSKRFYKKDSARSAVPEYSQVGTMIEGPTEYFSARMTKKERKRTLVDEVLDQERATKKLKAKYNEIQTAKMSGKKGHYKKMMQKRYGNKA